MGNKAIQDIYTMLGPFDFSTYKPPKKDTDGNRSDEDIDPE
jgi:hypothetical protein